MKNVLIIDSGVINHPKFEKLNICTTGFRNQSTLNDIHDNVGHGTAVVSLVSKGISTDEVQIYAMRLFEDFFECTIGNLIECLEYVAENNIYDVINMSFGITAGDDFDQIEELRTLCDKIEKQGTIIVSAYDNDGAISYPAFFENVIGVDTSDKINKRTEYEYVRNSCVNVLGYGKNQKVAWNNPLYTIIEGNSFACANVTNLIINMLVQGIDKKNIKQKLEKQAICINDYEEFVLPSNRPEWLKGSRVITFPFNKEMHSIYAYEDLIDFKIVGAYDLKYKALVGKDISDIISYKSIQSRIIKNFDDIRWDSEDFDGIIVGHIGELSAICKRDLMEEIIRNCIAYKKKIYAFDDFSEYSLKLQNKDYFKNNTYFPRISYENIPKGRFGKLFNIQMPVLAVIGTSSSQGKFTVQLSLRKKLQDAGYRVGQIGTEPSALCFDMDFSYPYGYKSTVYTSGYHNILLLNQAVHDIEMKGCDICVVGAQTNTTLYSYSNLKGIPLFQADILYGTMPDAFFLIVNAHDELDYIIRTMRSTEELIESKCIGIVVYPMMQKQAIGTLYKKERITDPEYEEFKGKVSQKVNVPILTFDTALNTDALVDLITNYFSEPEDILNWNKKNKNKMIYNVDDKEKIPMLFMPKVEQSISRVKSFKKEYALYIHIPFCEKRCNFCSIPVTQFNNEAVLDDYLNDLLCEMRIKGKVLENNVLKGIHIGGGTPSILSALQIKRLFDTITDQFGEELPEIVFEANPASLTKDKIDVLARYHNVTLNFGIQTFNPQRLREINRMDDVEYIKDCLRYAIGKKNLHVGIDLIVGLPNSKTTDFDDDLKVVRELEIKNVFVYSYRLEEKSFFYNHSNERTYLSQRELIRNMEYAEEKMQNYEYVAKSIYYWTREEKTLYLYTSHQMNGSEWMGIGVGAYSYLDNSVMCNDLVERNYQKWFIFDDENRIFSQNVTSQLIWDMSFMVKRDYFDTKRITRKYGKIAEPYLQGLIKKLDENGYSQRKNNKVCLSIKGKVLLDNVDEIIQEVVLN